MHLHAPAGGDAFLTTRWSLVLKAGGAGAETESRAALESLCRSYWQPLYFFARRQGHGPEAAADFTQDVFALIAGGELLQRVSQERGRFRSYLLGVLKNVMSQAREREAATKRGGGAAKLSLDCMEAEERYRLCPADHESPEVIFDRHWAQTVMARTLERLAADYAAAGHADRFAVLKDYLLTGKQETSGATAAAALGMTDAALRSAIFKVRQRFAATLRAEVAETVSSEAEAEEELRHLARMLGA